MASAKEIRSKIQSVQSTQKITKAMQVVAASKMRKTQERMIAGRPYSDTIREVINHLTLGNLEYRHPYIEEREVKRVGFIIISTDRSLCGGLNINLFKTAIIEMEKLHQQQIGLDLTVIGRKAVEFFSSIKANIVSQVTGLADNPTLNDLIGPVNVMLQKYDEGKIDKLYIASNRFINTMVQEPVINQLLPLPKEADLKETDNASIGKRWDYIYEPDSAYLLNVLLQRYIESQVYQSVIDNLACEQAARMVSMKAATENGENIISELQLVYNKARQFSITQELTEIVSGADAVSG